MHRRRKYSRVARSGDEAMGRQTASCCALNTQTNAHCPLNNDCMPTTANDDEPTKIPPRSLHLRSVLHLGGDIESRGCSPRGVDPIDNALAMGVWTGKGGGKGGAEEETGTHQLGAYNKWPAIEDSGTGQQGWWMYQCGNGGGVPYGPGVRCCTFLYQLQQQRPGSIGVDESAAAG